MPRTPEQPDISQTSFHAIGREHADLVEGMQFRASLQLRTPLIALEHDGEMQPVDEELPKYGPPWAGTWIPKPKAETTPPAGDAPPAHGADGAPPTQGAEDARPAQGAPLTRCAEIGYVPDDGGRYLPFLKAYRRIVEADETVERKLQMLEVFRRGHEHYEFTRGFGGDWPQMAMEEELTRGLPVDATVAAALFSAGLRDVAPVRAAKDEALLAVKGIGPKTLAAIRETLARAVESLTGTAGIDSDEQLDAAT